jgi:hypothetical protein
MRVKARSHLILLDFITTTTIIIIIIIIIIMIMGHAVV